MISLRFFTAAFLTLFVADELYAACNMYQYRRDLENSYEITLNNSCSVSNIIELGQIGKDKVTVELSGFRLEQIKQIASVGVLLKTTSRNLSTRNLQEIASENASRLTVNLSRINAVDAKNIAVAGANIILDSSFRSDDVIEICQKLVAPASGKVIALGFIGSALENIAQAGCVIVDESQSGMPFFLAENIASKGGRIELGSNFSGLEVRKLAVIAAEKLTVDLNGFPTFDAKKITEAGANINLDSSFSGFYASEICKLVKSPAIGKVRKSGFSDFDLRRISESGCKIFY